MDAAVKPRILIADDSRIVRASLIKHIEGVFDFREALDGEQAWEILLLDPLVRVVITDLLMPKLDGYALLSRIRASRIRRIRDIPVIVVSGSDEQQERARAKAAGATDLITKGIGTAQLLSRLDILSSLIGAQGENEPDMGRADAGHQQIVFPAEVGIARAEAFLTAAEGSDRDFVLFVVCVGVHSVDGAQRASTPAPLISEIERILQRNVRETDCVSSLGEGEFFVAAEHIGAGAAKDFAQRLCAAIVRAHIPDLQGARLLVRCGTVCSDEFSPGDRNRPFRELLNMVRRRAGMAVDHRRAGVIGVQEDGLAKHTGTRTDTRLEDVVPPDLPTLLQWIRTGRQADVLPHLVRLEEELQPLFDLLRRQGKS